MTTDYKVTELFCIIDEFCKHFDAENAGNLLEDNSGVKRRRRAASLSDSEIMTILLYFHFGTFRNFKHYYLFFIKGTMKSYFPKAVSYNRFVELESRVFFQLMFFLNLGAFGRCTGITWITCKSVWLCINSCEPKKEELSVNNTSQLRSELLNFSIKRFCCSIC